MTNIINHSWISENLSVNNFNELSKFQQDFEVCRYFYNHESFPGNSRDRYLDPAATSEDFVDVKILPDSLYDNYDSDFSAIASIGILEVSGLSNLFGIPPTLLSSPTPQSFYPNNTVVEVFFSYKNNLKDVDGQPFYHPTQCLGEFTPNGWVINNVTPGYIPHYGEDREYSNILRSARVPLNNLLQVMNCIYSSGGDSILDFVSGRYFILNPGTYEHDKYFGYSSNEEKYYIINENQYLKNISEASFEFCKRSPNNKKYGPYTLDKILGDDFINSYNQKISERNIDVVKLKDINDIIVDFCNMKHSVWDDNSLSDPFLTQGIQHSHVIDWCEVDVLSNEINYSFVNSGFLGCLDNLFDEKNNADNFEFYKNNEDGHFFCAQPYFREAPPVLLRNYMKYQYFNNDIIDFIFLGDASAFYLMSNPLGIEDVYESVPYKNLLPIPRDYLESNKNHLIRSLFKNNAYSLDDLDKINSKDTSLQQTSLFGLNFFYSSKTNFWMYNVPNNIYNKYSPIDDYYSSEEMTIDNKFALEASKFCDPFQTGKKYSDQNYLQIPLSYYDVLYGPDREEKHFYFQHNPVTPVPSDYYYRSLYLTNYNINYCKREVQSFLLDDVESQNLYEKYYKAYKDELQLPSPENFNSKISISCSSCVLNNISTRIKDMVIPPEGIDYLSNFDSIIYGTANIFGMIEERDNLKNVGVISLNLSRLPISTVSDFENWLNNIHLFKEEVNSNLLPTSKPIFSYTHFDQSFKENLVEIYYKSKVLSDSYNYSKFNTPIFLDFRVGLESDDSTKSSPHLDFLSLYQKLGLSNISIYFSHSNLHRLFGFSLNNISEDILNKYQDTLPIFHLNLGCFTGDYTRVSNDPLEANYESYNAVQFGLFKTKLFSGMIGATNFVFGSIPLLTIGDITKMDPEIKSTASFFTNRNSNLETRYRFNHFLNGLISEMDFLYKNKDKYIPGSFLKYTYNIPPILNNLYAYNYYGDPRLNLNFDTSSISRNYSVSILDEGEGTYYYSNSGLTLPSNFFNIKIERHSKDNLYLLKSFICTNDTNVDSSSFDHSYFISGQYGDTRVLPVIESSSQFSSKNCYPLYLSNFDVSLSASGWNDSILSSSTFLEYDHVPLYLSKYPDFSKHFSLFVSPNTNLNNNYLNFDESLNSSFITSPITDISEVGVLFNTWRNNSFSDSATTLVNLNIPQTLLYDKVLEAKDLFESNNNFFDELNIVFTIETLGSSTNIYHFPRTSSSTWSNYGYYNCDFYEAHCANEQNCGVSRGCASNLVVGSNLLNYFDLN